MALNFLFLNNRFLPAESLSERNIALIEHTKGKLMLVHVVDKNFYCCMLEKDEKYNIKLSDEYQTLVLQLKESLYSTVIQLFMVQTLNDLYLLNVSLFPNWEFNTNDHRNKIFRDLVLLLSKRR